MAIQLDCLVILIATVFLILLWKAATFVFSQSNVPGPKGNWLTGQLFEIMQTKDMMQTSHEWVKTYGPIVKYRPMGIFGPDNYIISDADALKQILVTKSFKYHRPLLRGGFISPKNVLQANGKEHSRMRKMLNPAFKVSHLKSMVDLFHEKAEVLTESWSETIRDKESGNKRCQLPVQDDLVRMTLDVLGECVFGYKFNSITTGHTPISQAFNDATTGLDKSIVNIMLWKLLDKIPFYQGSERIRAAIKATNTVIKEVIHNKRQEQNDVSTTSKDLLDLFLKAVDDETGQGMDEEELHSQSFIFLMAGHETTSTALSWILYFLAQYPDVQEKLRAEVKETRKEGPVSWETYDSMEYLAAVVNEALRLRTPAPFYRRKIIEDDNILGYNLPSGSLIVVPLYTLHRKPEYWTDPDTFNPDRFLEPDKQNNPNNRFAFLPFSTGPRMCVGYRFAMMQVKTVVATLIENFSFSMVPGMSFGGSFTRTSLYKPKPSLQLHVRKVID